PKLNARVLELWATLLGRVPNSRLMLLASSPGKSERRLHDLLDGFGVDPARVDIRPRVGPEVYLRLYEQIDIALDPFPFSGHTTTCDALWMGVPVVTLPGATYASRMSASVLHHAGLSHLIASSPQQYISIASRLAGDVANLGRIRQELRQRLARSDI